MVEGRKSSRPELRALALVTQGDIEQIAQPPVAVVARPPPADALLVQRQPAVATSVSTTQVRLAALLSGVWRAVAIAPNGTPNGIMARQAAGTQIVERVQLSVQADGSVRGGPVPDVWLSEGPESSAVLSSDNAFLVRGQVELTADGFIGEMSLQQLYVDGAVTHWKGHFFADESGDAHPRANRYEEPAAVRGRSPAASTPPSPPPPAGEAGRLVFCGGWSGAVEGEFSATLTR